MSKLVEGAVLPRVKQGKADDWLPSIAETKNGTALLHHTSCGAVDNEVGSRITLCLLSMNFMVCSF
jgi:hypothetical protein